MDWLKIKAMFLYKLKAKNSNFLSKRTNTRNCLGMNYKNLSKIQGKKKEIQINSIKKFR
jgi:hypothetical protein